jgi:hypothetical protein
MPEEIDQTKAIDMLRRARLKLSGAKYRFFGLCLYSIRVLLFHEDSGVEGRVRYDLREDGSAEYENKIHLNSKFIDDHLEYKVLNMIDIMLHELNHILRRHDIRMGERDSVLWNIACDHIIDKSIRKLNISKPIIGYNIIKEIENDSRYQSEEAVYNWLVAERKKEYGKLIEIEKQEDGSVNIKETFNGHEWTLYPDLARSNDNLELSPEQQQVIENYISQVRAIYNIEQERGNIPGNIKEEFDNLLQVKVPWENLLEKAIKTSAFEKVDRRNWRRLNKFYTNLNINLPGRISHRENNGVGTLLIHIDSSGSMSSKVLKKAGYVIYRSINYFEKVILVIADSSIHSIKEFKKNNNEELLQFFKDEGIKGRGGTSHYYVFKYFNEYYENNINDLSICISITDMYSDIEHNLDKFEFWKKIPLILLSTSNKIINRENVTTICVD